MVPIHIKKGICLQDYLFRYLSLSLFLKFFLNIHLGHFKHNIEQFLKLSMLFATGYFASNSRWHWLNRNPPTYNLT
jgi:hypothetical protein